MNKSKLMAMAYAAISAEQNMPKPADQLAPTPRTDANLRGWSYFDVPAPIAEFARQLERELSAKTAEAERLKTLWFADSDPEETEYCDEYRALAAIAQGKGEK